MVLCQLRLTVSEVSRFFCPVERTAESQVLEKGKVWGVGRVRRTRT